MSEPVSVTVDLPPATWRQLADILQRPGGAELLERALRQVVREAWAREGASA